MNESWILKEGICRDRQDKRGNRGISAYESTRWFRVLLRSIPSALFRRDRPRRDNTLEARDVAFHPRVEISLRAVLRGRTERRHLRGELSTADSFPDGAGEL